MNTVYQATLQYCKAHTVEKQAHMRYFMIMIICSVVHMEGYAATSILQHAP